MWSRCSPSTPAARRRCGIRRSSACSSSISAIGLFCGSVYLLLGTNLGGRLGFLVVGRVPDRLHGVALEPVDHDRDAAQQPEGPARRVGRSIEVVDDPSDVEHRARCTTSPRTATPSTSKSSRSSGRPSTPRSSRRSRKVARRHPSSRSRSSAAAPTSSPTSRASRRSRPAATRRTSSGTTRGTPSSSSATRSRSTSLPARPRPRRCDPLTPKRYVVMRVRLRIAAAAAVDLLLHLARAVRALPARPPLVREGRTRTQEARPSLRPVPTS